MKHIPVKTHNGPTYAHGSLAPGKSVMKMCPNCGRRIKYEAVRCEGCNAEKANGWKPMELAADYDFHVKFVSCGGRFKKGEIVNVYEKNGYMAFKTENGGENFVNLEKDFFVCAKTSTTLGEMVTLTFSNFTINMRNDETAEKIIINIYANIADKVYEREKAFYNAAHDLFPA